MGLESTAPTNQVDRFAQRIAVMERRIADLERAGGRDLALDPSFSSRYVSLTAGVGLLGAKAGAFHAGNSGAGGSADMLTAGAFTAVAGRRYKITVSWGSSTQVGAGVGEVQIWRGVGGTQLVTTPRHVAAGTVPGGAIFCDDVPGAGSVNYVLHTFTNATSMQLLQQYSIIVEDVGT